MLSIILQLICIASTLSTKFGENISKYIGDMINTVKNPAQIDIYRILHPTTAKLMCKFHEFFFGFVRIFCLPNNSAYK